MSNKSVSDFVAATMDAVLKSESHKALFGQQYKFAQDSSSGKDSMCAVHGKMDSCSADDHSADTNNDDSIDWATKQNLPGDPLAGLNKEVPAGPGGGSAAKPSTPWKPFSDIGKPGAGPGGKGHDPSQSRGLLGGSNPGATPGAGSGTLIPGKGAADDGMADDNDARKKKHTSSDSTGSGTGSDTSSADDSGSSGDDHSAEDDDNDARKKKLDSSDENKVEASFNMAIDSLLTASAALDSLGMVKSSAFSLKLASLVVEAKKKEKDSKKKDTNAAKDKAAKEKAAKEKAKAKEKHDSQMAKDKASKEKASKEKAAKEKAAKEKAKQTASKSTSSRPASSSKK